MLTRSKQLLNLINVVDEGNAISKIKDELTQKYFFGSIQDMYTELSIYTGNSITIDSIYKIVKNIKASGNTISGSSAELGSLSLFYDKVKKQWVVNFDNLTENIRKDEEVIVILAQLSTSNNNYDMLLSDFL